MNCREKVGFFLKKSKASGLENFFFKKVERAGSLIRYAGMNNTENQCRSLTFTRSLARRNIFKSSGDTL